MVEFFIVVNHSRTFGCFLNSDTLKILHQLLRSSQNTQYHILYFHRYGAYDTFFTITQNNITTHHKSSWWDFYAEQVNQSLVSTITKKPTTWVCLLCLFLIYKWLQSSLMQLQIEFLEVCKVKSHLKVF